MTSIKTARKSGTALFIASASVDRRMGGDSVTKSKALHYAEAGVAEALARIQSGSGPDPAAVNAARPAANVAALAAGIAYAISDEMHQLFVAGRVGSPIDVAIDSAGVAIGVLLWRRYSQTRRTR